MYILFCYVWAKLRVDQWTHRDWGSQKILPDRRVQRNRPPEAVDVPVGGEPQERVFGPTQDRVEVGHLWLHPERLQNFYIIASLVIIQWKLLRRNSTLFVCSVNKQDYYDKLIDYKRGIDLTTKR